MLTRRVQVAGGWRPPLPPLVPAAVAGVIKACWKGEPCLRASAGAVVRMLQGIEESGACRRVLRWQFVCPVRSKVA